MKAINWIIKKLEVFFEFVNKIKEDKWKHLKVGLPIYGASLLLLGSRVLIWWDNPFYLENQNHQYLGAALITTTIATGWELNQKRTGKGVADYKDVIATVAIAWIVTTAQILFSL